MEDLNALVAAGRKLHAIYADPPWAFEVCSGKDKQVSRTGWEISRVPPSGSPGDRGIEGGSLAFRMPDRLPHGSYLSLHSKSGARAKSLRQIAAALSGRGIATARGGKWEAATVRNILKQVA